MDYNFDRDKLIADVSRVIQYSQNINPEVEFNGVPAMIDEWFRNKQLFIDHIGGELIYQANQPISFELDEKGKEDKLNNFIDQIENHYENWDLSYFLRSLNTDDFYNNLTTKKFRYNGIIIPENFKVVKAFKFFETDENILKQLQSEASRIIQENVISGYLCFSVHPLDYLSVSENVHNWRSCHALDGDYRSGNLNYMMDPTTVVCYLRADKQAVLPHFPEDVLWNSKKWRVLLFFSNDQTLMFAGRQYPFTANKGIDIIKDSILPCLGFGKWGKWKDTFIRSHTDELSGETVYLSSMIPLGTTAKDFKEVVVDNMNTFQFNDLLRSSVYSPIWTYRANTLSFWNDVPTGCSCKDTKVVVGQSCPCPVCGEKEVSYPNIMLCPTCADIYSYENCEDYYECEVCGSMTYIDDMYNLDFSDIRVCENCYRTETVECQICGTRDLPEQVKYRKGDSRCLCPDCWHSVSRDNARKSSTLFF